MQRARSQQLAGFTIIELLVVIVVIGVLAAITIVSYTGIAQKTAVASLQSDLSNAARQLKMFQVENSAYPNSISDCPTPAAGNLCLKSTPGNSYSSYSANNSTSPPTFTLTASNGAMIYKVTDASQPIQLAPAPLTPVADWLATTQGDHYGNFFDLVSGSYATVARSTPKTIYDSATQKIYDVPANYLGVRPRSDGKSGSEAEIEERRTNYLVNSYGLANDGSKWTTGWIVSPTVTGTPALSLAGGVYGANASRIRYTWLAGDTGKKVSLDSFAVTGFSAGESVTVSAYIKGAKSGGTIHLDAVVLDSAGVWIGTTTGVSIIPTTGWQRVSTTYSALPANAAKVVSSTVWASAAVGDILDITVDAAQLEKGAFATSYIPTTTAAITRNADVVTVPTTGWNAGAGTWVAVAGETRVPASYPTLCAWEGTDAASNRIRLQRNGGSYGNLALGSRSAGVPVDSGQVAAAPVMVFAGSWVNAGNLSPYLNGTPGTAASGFTTPVALTTAYLGSTTGAAAISMYNGPIHRLTVYSSALSPSDVATVTNAVKDGP